MFKKFYKYFFLKNLVGKIKKQEKYILNKKFKKKTIKNSKKKIFIVKNLILFFQNKINIAQCIYKKN